MDPALRLTASLGLVAPWPCPPPGYLVGEVLGVGRRGVVWSALHRSTGQGVVLERVRSPRAGAASADGAASGRLGVLKATEPPKADETSKADEASVTAERRPPSLLSRARLLGGWVALDDPHVVRVLPPVLLPLERSGADADELVLVSAAVEHRLADLLRGRRLRRRQVVAASLGIAQGLAAAHRAGLVHGRLGLDSVLVHRGKVLLGPPRFDDGAARECSAPADVAALARLVGLLWTGHRMPPLLARTLADCQDVTTGADAAAVAAALRTCGKPAALPKRVRRHRLVPTRRGTPLHLTRTQWLLSAVAGVVVLGVGVRGLAPGLSLGAHLLGGHGSAASQPAPSGTPGLSPRGRVAASEEPSAASLPPATAGPVLPPASAAPSPSDAVGAAGVAVTAGKPTSVALPADAVRGPIRSDAQALAVLTELDQRRAFAFAMDDEQALRELYVPGSAVLAEDLRTLTDLRRRGLSAIGLRLPVVHVALVSQDNDRVLLRVTDRRDPYRLVDRQARVVEEVTGRGERAWLVELRRVAQGPGGEGGALSSPDDVAAWRYASSRSTSISF